MRIHSLPLVIALPVMSMVGCSTSSDGEEYSDDLGTTEAALTPASLRARTALERTRVLGAAKGSVQVDYAPTSNVDYAASSAGVAFEAVHFDASREARKVTVVGDFPSSATVLVTDEQFRVVAAGRTVERGAGVEQARLRVPGGSGGRFVLVRDRLWVKPMVFEVNVDL